MTIAYERLEGGRTRKRPVGSLIGHGSAQALRLAVIYALLDGAERVGVEHVDAAVAFWSYCSRSVREIFGTA